MLGHASLAMLSMALRTGGLRRAVIDKRASRGRTAAITSDGMNTEAARITSPGVPAFLAVIRASATNRWALLALIVEPSRSQVAAITGLLLVVLIVASIMFRALHAGVAAARALALAEPKGGSWSRARRRRPARSPR
jgi:hypothetical protein